MKKWLPYVVAVVVALVAVVLLLRPTDTPTAASPAGTTATTKTTTTTASPGEVEAPTEAAPASPGPEGATPDRPTTQAELNNAARQARPFNQHVDLVASFWGVAGKTASTEGHTELAAEMDKMIDYLRTQRRQNDDSLDVGAVLQQEIVLAEKVKGAGLADPMIPGMMTYIIDTAKVTLAGGDPRTVTRPTREQMGG